MEEIVARMCARKNFEVEKATDVFEDIASLGKSIGLEADSAEVEKLVEDSNNELTK